ncbi:hypothetical protein OsJ_28820 [Oryza sativa Japonica Group]|uniref:Disease resistance N-terminal domain-containing protein n=1 Tax=Oryza sativa subsp. japonica TaxID=39947 RepID=B9G2T6_ORYSJ|nr:hypothetical protein OsJ_28820 [Oryza sativa Japonica Group]
MEAAIVSGITKEVITSLKTSAVNEIAKLVCVKKEIKNLTVTFDDICAQIRGADQIVAHSEATNYRLKLLREYAYEAENIIDLFSIELGGMQEPRLQSPVAKMKREKGRTKFVLPAKRKTTRFHTSWTTNAEILMVSAIMRVPKLTDLQETRAVALGALT